MARIPQESAAEHIADALQILESLGDDDDLGPPSVLLEADTDGAGNSIDSCAKCGKPHQPRSSASFPSPTSPTSSASAEGGGARTKRKYTRRAKKSAPTRRSPAKRSPRGSGSIEQTVALLEAEIGDLVARQADLNAAIDALRSLNGGPRK